MASQPQPADANLVKFLRGFYSVGQLQIILMTYTDGGQIPGLPDREKEMRIAAIRHILGETPIVATPKLEESETPMQQTESPKFPLGKASLAALTLVNRLTPFCDKIHIAGSIRRQKSEVKDMEIVALPSRKEVLATNLFDTTSGTIVVPEFGLLVEQLGSIIKGKPDGRYMQILLPSGMKLDLFMPTATDYWRQFAIRTGSADYSANVIAAGWKAKGWCGTDQGLRLIRECEQKSSGWKCINLNPVQPPAWQSEEEFFDFIGVRWIEPKLRTI